MRDFFFSSFRTHLKNPTDHAVFRAFPSDHVGPGGTMPSASGQESKQTNLREHKSSLSFPASSFSLTWKVVFCEGSGENDTPFQSRKQPEGVGKFINSFSFLGGGGCTRRLCFQFPVYVSGCCERRRHLKERVFRWKLHAVTDTGCYDMGCVWTTQTDVAKS